MVHRYVCLEKASWAGNARMGLKSVCILGKVGKIRHMIFRSSTSKRRMPGANNSEGSELGRDRCGSDPFWSCLGVDVDSGFTPKQTEFPSVGRTLVLHPGCESIFSGSPIVAPSG
jgi:hypothetical protein